MNKILSNKYTFTTQITSYTRRGKHRPPITLKVGDKVGKFQLLKNSYYRNFDLTHLQLKHSQFQTNIHQLQCAEENNTLSMVFNTKGLAKPAINYALEKLLQCGSNKYPIRNLPAEMSMRSFSQLAPSQTTDDYLMFSFNSPITKDFANIFDVYSSMIFDPMLREEDFFEVIRRFTYEKERLGFTGELAGELMQSQFNIDQTIYSLITEELLGKSSQSICKPLDLIKINYSDLVKYYKETITLPNCTFILHGDMNINQFINQFDRIYQTFKPKTYSPIFIEESVTPTILPKTISFDHLKQETMLIRSYRIDNPTDQQNTLLQILSYLLFDMPDSPFMKFNSPQTPYPNLYGYHQRYFNVGVTFQQFKFDQEKHLQTAETFKKRQRLFIEKEQEIVGVLNDVMTHKFNDRMIQKCLFHLQNNFYERRGFNIIQSIVDKVLKGKSLSSTFEVTAFISKLLKTYRKENVFQNIMNKFLINNNQYLVMKGFNNPHLIQNEQSRNGALLIQMQNTLSNVKLHQIAGYSPPTYLQDTNLLPQIHPSQLQFFQDVSGQEIKIKNIKTTFSPRHYGNKLTFKFDVTDIGQDDIPLLALFCKGFPQMGYRAIKSEAFTQLLSTYVGQLDMNYQTVKSEQGKLKIFIYLNIQFSDRNYQFAFNVLNGLFTDFNHNNIFTLSKIIQSSATNCFNQVSENLLHYHGLHLAASKSPYAFFQSPIYQARTLCSIAGDMKKIGNPKGYLMSLSHKFQQIWNKMMCWSKIQLLWQCHPDQKAFYKKYIDILLGQIKNEGIPPQFIDVTTFPHQKWQKYYPNYDQQISFEAFSIPYRTKDSPAALVLSSMINHNISVFNKIGGCYLYKGALISFIQGSRQKYIQLQQYYKKIQKIDVAKRKIFQHFDRFTVQQQFKSGVTFAQARFFKQAVLAVNQSQVEQILTQCILKPIKQGSSSLLALGARLQNYQPLLKKGWQIQRSIDDVSLGMQSLSKQQIQFKLQKYIDIC